jgi:hypothetical protein
MQQRKTSFRKSLLLLVILLLIALGSAVVLLQEQTVVSASTDLSQPQALVDANDMLLVWIGDGAAPGKHSASAPGQLVLMDSQGGNIQPVMDVPQQSSRVFPCGEGATSPDNAHFAFYVGGDVGTLYMMTGAAAHTSVREEFQALGCVGGDTLQYSPDSKRFAYLAYEPGAAEDEFADGWLHIANTSDKAEIASFPGVTSFDVTNDTLAFVRFFTTDKGEADEAGVFLWDGNTDREVATLYPTENCRFTSAQIAIVADGRLVLVMGHRCKTGDTRTSWQFYTVDPSSRSFVLSMSDFQTGQFAPYAKTNNIFVAPNSETVYFTIPDGITASTTGLVAVDMANISADNVLIPNNAVMPRFDPKPYDFAKNAGPVVSPDGRWLAIVTNTPNSEATVYVFDMNDPALEPVMVPIGRRGDSVSEMAFSPDSKRLVFVAGGNDGGENSLFAVDLESGSDFRVKRGRYGHGAVSSDSKAVALMEWQQVEDPKQPLYLNLVMVDIESSATATLWEGAEIVDGEVTNQRFIYPLAWRRN